MRERRERDEGERDTGRGPKGFPGSVGENAQLQVLGDSNFFSPFISLSPISHLSPPSPLISISSLSHLSHSSLLGKNPFPQWVG